MKVQLRLRNPDPNSEAEDFFVSTDSPSESEIEGAIMRPNPPDGLCRYGDLLLSRWDLGRHLRFYLGAPGKAVVVYQPDDKSLKNEWIRIDPSGSDNVFLVCPDMAPDEYYRWPHAVFVPSEDALRIAQEFVESNGAEIQVETNWNPFDYVWIDYEDSPYYPTRSEHAGDGKPDPASS